MNTAPESLDGGWSEEVAAYFTFGPGGTTCIYVLTALGFALFVVAMVAWVVTENRKLQAHAARLRASGIVTESMPGGEAHHTPSMEA